MTDEEAAKEAFGGLDINKFLKKECYQDYSDSNPNGFYSVYRGVFE